MGKDSATSCCVFVKQTRIQFNMAPFFPDLQKYTNKKKTTVMFHMLCDGPIIYYMFQSDLCCNTKVNSQEDQQVRGEMTLVFYLIFLDTHKILFL